jgi:hypothetical protein
MVKLHDYRLQASSPDKWCSSLRDFLTMEQVFITTMVWTWDRRHGSKSIAGFG